MFQCSLVLTAQLEVAFFEVCMKRAAKSQREAMWPCCSGCEGGEPTEVPWSWVLNSDYKGPASRHTAHLI